MSRWRPTEIRDAATALARAGLLRPISPLALVRGAAAVARDGITPAAAYELAAARHGFSPAITDQRGTWTFAEMASLTARVAGSLRALGVGSGDRIGVLCRNHRQMVLAVAAASALGADVVLLNVSFAGPQLKEVLDDQRVTSVVFDEELADVLSDARPDIRRIASRGGGAAGYPALEELPPAERPALRFAPRHSTRYVLLTSGTTGRPKGAGRQVPLSLEPVVAILSRIPYRAGDTAMIAAPLFHAWGFANLAFGLGLGWHVVLRDHFDAEATLEAVSASQARVLVAVPVMLQRMLELPDSVRRHYDLACLEVVAVSGSALPSGLATAFMDAYGEVLYNLYGSTEAGWASVAGPGDLRAAPDCAGVPPVGTRLRIADEEGHDAPAGATGRILVRNGLLLPGVLPASRSVGRYLDTGDRGRLDEQGRLFVEGRSDDMIVSGGENVYPFEVEQLLGTHPAIAEAAAVGVPDERFGQRVKVLVVVRPGTEISADEVKSFVRRHLARYKVPRDVEFVSELPRNETGKVLHR